MDLYFDSDKGKSFAIEVGYFDTIKEIKEKVTKYQGIPVLDQILQFDGKILPDDLNIHTSEIVDGSHLKLISATATATTTDQTATNIKTEETDHHSSSSSNKIKIFLKKFGVTVEMDVNDLVSKLKEKINEIEGVPLCRISVYANGNELHDHKSLHECQLVDGSEVEITLKPPTPPPTLPTTTTTSTTTSTTASTTAACSGLNMGFLGNYAKKLKINVMSKSGEKIALEVNPLCNVGELRKELQKIRNQGVGFGLPEEGYFFIYKQNVMEEDQSFRWHRVAQGDTIEIFNGCVTGGS
ncbi:ubiquitin domain-containing protein 7SL RNA1-like [Rutidosis leptorrhynchoides]|uniref:ubiquitin domain-containing protein 7SL RNA1-like n=1 Tax=Rutidosis leptorrhynchoides TaxID=125765 RepID=UPI003A98E708